jgi:DNA-binding NtrC family response regulator
MSTRKESILVVDDEPEICWALGKLLRDEGYNVTVTQHRKEAMEKTSECEFSVALLDAKLLETDGLDLARKMRSRNKRLPILLISGYYSRDDTTIQKIINDGIISEFIAKPFEHDKVIKAVERTLCGGRFPPAARH